MEFLELHSVSRLEASCSREAVFQYLVLLSVQVAATRGKVSSHRNNILKAKILMIINDISNKYDNDDT